MSALTAAAEEYQRLRTEFREKGLGGRIGFGVRPAVWWST